MMENVFLTILFVNQVCGPACPLNRVTPTLWLNDAISSGSISDGLKGGEVITKKVFVAAEKWAFFIEGENA
jgi:hypothetical protein